MSIFKLQFEIVIDSRPRYLIMIITPPKMKKNVASTLLKRYSKNHESNIKKDNSQKIKMKKKILH